MKCPRGNSFKKTRGREEKEGRCSKESQRQQGHRSKKDTHSQKETIIWP